MSPLLFILDDLPASAVIGLLIVTLGLGAFLGLVVGFRIGHRDGRSEAEMNQREHWVELLERSVSQTRSRAAHPSRSSADQERTVR